jgi:hypothetical protein
MTFDECQRELETIRRRQGTPMPMIRVDYGGSCYKGRLSRSDSDPDNRPPASTPFGVLVLEEPGLVRGPQTILQIASIDLGAISDPTSN